MHYVFDEKPFTRQSKTEDKKAEGFQILHFYWSFSGDTAVKGLNTIVFLVLALL